MRRSRGARMVLAASLVAAAPAVLAPRPAPAQARKPAARPPAQRPATPRPPAQRSGAPEKATGPALPSRLAPGDPFCIVNGVRIPVSTYIDRLSLGYAPQVREALIEEALVREEAARRKLTVSPAEVRALVDRVLAAEKERFGGEAGLAEELKRNRGWTVADYRTVLETQADVQVLRNKIAATLVPESAVTDAQVEERYTQHRDQYSVPDQVRIAHILVRRPDDAADPRDGAARERANGLLQRVRQAGGANFAEVAKDSSDDRLTGEGGGIIPTPITRGGHPFGADFEASVFSAEKGVLERVVATPLGYHIIRVDEQLPGRQRPLAEVRGQIRDALLAERRQQQFEELMVRLRTAARVEVGKF